MLLIIKNIEFLYWYKNSAMVFFITRRTKEPFFIFGIGAGRTIWEGMLGEEEPPPLKLCALQGFYQVPREAC